MDFTKGDLAKSKLIKKYNNGFLCHLTLYIYSKYTIGDIYPSFDILHLILSKDIRCCFEMENLITTYKVPQD